MLASYEDDIIINDQPHSYNNNNDNNNGYQQEAYNELLDDIENIGQNGNNINNEQLNDLDAFPLNANDINNNNNNNNDNNGGSGGGGMATQFSSQILDDDGSFPLVSFVNSLSCWHLPTLDHSSWFCIGIYIILMVVIPFIKDGSTSIIFALNIPIFLIYCAWYRWFADTSVKPQSINK